VKLSFSCEKQKKKKFTLKMIFGQKKLNPNSFRSMEINDFYTTMFSAMIFLNNKTFDREICLQIQHLIGDSSARVFLFLF